MSEHILCIGALAEPIIKTLQQRYVLHRISGDPKVALEPSKEWALIRAIVTGGVIGAKAPIIDALPALEMIAINGVGTDAVDLARCAARGIAVKPLSAGLKTAGATRARDGAHSDVLTDDVADMAMGLLIACSRNIVIGDNFVRGGKWGSEPFPGGIKVSGKRLGIFGLGQIGKAVARRAEGFDMQVSYTSRHVADGVRWPRIERLVDLAAWSDFLVICAPGTPETAATVDAAVLAALGPSGSLINVARGSIVHEAALIDALTTRKIRAAGLDVFWDEPRVPEALRKLDNVVLTPHQGSTQETRAVMTEILIGLVDDHFASRQ
jgi:lactate dehydrogenase-like 2-hydroxyacid dehydrogenase